MSRTLAALETDLRFNLSRALNRSFVRPDWVSINLTLRCNLRCPMCTTCYDLPEELGTREILDIIDQVAAWGVRILNPLGGEPFMREDLIQILEYACLKDFYITLTTNGTLMSPEKARGIARIAYDRLHFNFSIDGFEETHDRIRGPGTFAKTLEGFDNLRRADAAAGNPFRKVVVNCVVNNLNLEALPSFLEFCRSRGFQGVQLLTLFKQDRQKIPREIKHLWIPRGRLDVLDRVVEQVLAFKAACDPLHFMVANTEHELEIMKRYYRGSLPPRKARCYAGWKELYINADGRAIMCDGQLDFLAGAFGDVRQQTLQQMWKSEALRENRRAIKACSAPCIQDCYLRESSDSLAGIGAAFGKKVLEEVRRLRPSRPVSPTPAGRLCLELSDVSDVNPSHDINRSKDRFEQLTLKLPIPFDRCYGDPFEYYEMRNRGYLNFNRGFMGFELIKRFVPDLVRAGIRMRGVRLGFKGDPLLHPEFVPVYRYLLEQSQSHKVFGEIRTDTYATLLNTEIVDLALLAPQVRQTFFVILDAANRETYRKINGTDLLEVVMQRLDYVLARKAAGRSSHLRLILVFTVLPDNEHEAVDFERLWRKKLIEQGLAPPVTVLGELPETRDGGFVHDLVYFRRKDNDNFLAQLESNAALGRVARALGIENPVIDRDDGRVPRCPCPFETPTITWDGKVTVCEQDRLLQLRIGEVTNGNLAEIWGKSEGGREMRQAVERGELHLRLPCRDCRFPFSPNAPLRTI